MILEKRILEFQAAKKASFDGKAYLIRLPAEIVRFINDRGIQTEDVLMEGVWSMEDGTLSVLMIFGKKFIETKSNQIEEKEDEDYVVLGD